MFRNGVRFSTGNIVDRSFFEAPETYDAVLCRNVLIYFSREALHRAIENLAYCLRPGGLLFLGSESLIGKTDLFEPVSLGSTVVYQKVK
jgi:chemotaxis protein methyltransferase CheR